MSSAAVVIGALMWLFSHVASQFLSCLNIITWLSILFTLQSRELPVNSNVYFSQGLSFWRINDGDQSISSKIC